jgi:arsenate reductase-like glutaredoxin family protein
MKNKAGISRCDRRFEFYLDWLKKAGIEYKILDYHENKIGRAHV